MRLALISTFFFYLLANTSAQTSETKEDPLVKFGINMGLNYSNAFGDEQLPERVSITNGFGFRLEILAETRLTKRIFISPKMGFSFNDSKFRVFNPNGESKEFLLLPLSFEAGTHFQFKNESANSRPYFYIGPSIKIPIQGEISDTSNFGSSWTPSVDFGVGMDVDFDKFILAPELRYSVGFYSVTQDPNIGEGSIYFHNVSLIFNFLG